MTAAGPPGALAAALGEYVEARNSSLLAARKELGLGDLDARALRYIIDNPDVTPSELRAYLGITSAGTTTLVDRLIQRDAVRRDSHPEDRRMIRLTATVDVTVEPWSALTRFDERIAAAISRLDPESADDAAAIISSVTRSARG